MYWFRADRQTDGRWAFFRLFAVCPYDGAAYVSTIADRERAQRGGYQAVGPRQHGERRGQSSGGRTAPRTIDESWLDTP
jgi:hypothetical protein